MKKYTVYHHVSTCFSQKDVVDWMKRHGALPESVTDYEPTTQEITDYAYSLFQKGEYEYVDEDIYETP